MPRSYKPDEGKSLADLFPALASEADGWDPTTVGRKSNRIMQWKCAYGHVWQSAVNNRTAGNGCPYCSGRSVTVGVNDLATLHPEVAAMAHGWNPDEYSLFSNQKKVWQCPLGHEFESSIKNMVKQPGCRVCSNRRVLVGFNDLATTHPDIAQEAFNWDPTTVTFGSKKNVEWRCSQGHIWTTAVNARTTKGRGCGVCKNQILLPGYNDLATVNPELAAEAHGWDASDELAGSKNRREWKCPRGHVYEATLQNRMRGKNCPYCSHRRVVSGETDFASMFPDIAKEAHGWDPTTVTGSSKKKREWKCSLGHLWTAEVGSRARGNGCPICAGRVVLAGFNDLATANPTLAAEAYGWDPTTKTKYSPQKMKWKCSEGHIYLAAINNRSGGKGCPSCAQTGYDPNQNGYLYFLEHEEWDMLQIGITNFPDSRLKDHASRGWTTIDVRGPMDGYLTNDLETAILRSLKKRGALFANKAGGPRFDGWSEAWTTASLQVSGLKELLNFIREDES